MNQPAQPSISLATLRWTAKRMLARPKQMALVIGLFLMVGVCDVLTPFMVKEFLSTFEGEFDPQRSLVAAFWMIAICWFACYVFQYLGYTANNYYQTAGMAAIFRDLYNKIQFAPFRWHANQQMGATVVKVTRSVRGYEIFTDSLYLSNGLLVSVLTAIGAIAILFFHYPKIALAIGICQLIGTALLVVLTLKTVAPANRHANDEESHVNAAIADRIIGNFAVKSFAQEKREGSVLANIISRWRIIEYKSWGKGHIAGLIYEMILVVAISIGAYLCISYYQAGAMPLSDIAMVFFTISLINAVTRPLGRTFLNLQKSLNDMEDGMHIDNLPAEASGTKALPPFQQAIALTDVKFHYPEKDAEVINIPSLIIPKGQTVGLLGHSGAGKSTLASLLTRVYDVTHGQITIDGQSLQDTNVQSLREQIATIPQDTMLFHRSLAENIRYGNIDASDEEVIAAAKRAHAHEFIAALPNGYDTMVGERGVKLSGGQRQRIAIARAILKDAPILILDEATSALDTESEKLIQASIQELTQGKTVIAIAHRLSTIKHLDRLIVLEHGKIIEDGSHDELLKQNGRYAKLWQMQSGGFIGSD